MSIGQGLCPRLWLIATQLDATGKQSLVEAGEPRPTPECKDYDGKARQKGSATPHNTNIVNAGRSQGLELLEGKESVRDTIR